MLPIAAALIGICLGVVLADAQVPRVRLIPLIAALALTLAAAVALLLSNGAGLVEGLVFVVSTLLGSTAYGTVRWKTLLPAEARPSTGRLVVLALLRPAQLRETWHMAQVNAEAAQERARI